jgi:hypothetical protein
MLGIFPLYNGMVKEASKRQWFLLVPDVRDPPNL